MQFNPKKKRRVLINITSLIDVMFLLLIFFMVTSTFLDQPGMKLELPSAESAEVARVEKLVLYISSVLVSVVVTRRKRRAKELENGPNGD